MYSTPAKVPPMHEAHGTTKPEQAEDATKPAKIPLHSTRRSYVPV